MKPSDRISAIAPLLLPPSTVGSSTRVSSPVSWSRLDVRARWKLLVWRTCGGGRQEPAVELSSRAAGSAQPTHACRALLPAPPWSQHPAPPSCSPAPGASPTARRHR